MAVAGVQGTNVAGTDVPNNIGEKKDRVLKTYSYKDGKGQETVYHTKDMLELSLESYRIPVGCETYERLKSQMNRMSCLPHNKMFYETRDVMKDFYDGRITKEEVENIFKEYCYHAVGEPAPGDGVYKKQRATQALSELYEFFSRANTRCANDLNTQEAKKLLEGNGLGLSRSVYYNSDYYYRCEEMQELFRTIADELADAYGGEHVDFKDVEKNTKFTLDGGITFNGVWNYRVWSSDYKGYGSTGKIKDVYAVPPKGFLYCSISGYGTLEGKAQKIREDVEKMDQDKNYSNVLFILSEIRNMRGEGLYEKARGFLKQFDIKHEYRGSYLEFLRMAE